MIDKISIHITHHVDCSTVNADGKYGWYYEYDLIEFIDTQHALKLTARSDAKAPYEASFIDFYQHNGYFNQYLMHFSLRYLRKMGKVKINYISPQGFALKPEIPSTKVLKQAA